MGRPSQDNIQRIKLVIASLFMPKADPGAILREEYTNTEILSVDTLKKAQKDIKEIEIPVPDNLNDELIAFAVMGSAFTNENFRTIDRIMRGSGSSVRGGDDDFLGTGLCFFNHNLIKGDARINTQSAQLLVPKGRRDVKAAVEAGDDAAIKGYLTNAFNILYMQAVGNSGCEKEQYSNATEQLLMLDEALKEKNMSLADLGVTGEQLRMVAFLKARQTLVRSYDDLSDEISQAESQNLPMTDELRGKIYRYQALKFTIKSINNSIDPLVNLYSNVDFDSRDRNLAKRSMTEIETLISQAPDEFVNEITQRISSDPQNAYNGKDSVSNFMSSFETKYLNTYVKLENFDRNFLAGLIEKAKPFVLDPDGNPYTSSKSDANARYARMAGCYNELKNTRAAINGNYTPRNCEKLRSAIISFYKIASEVQQKEFKSNRPAMGEQVLYNFSAVLNSLNIYIDSAAQESLIKAELADIGSAMPSVRGTRDLYGVPPAQIKWGVSKGQHVTHISINESDLIEISNGLKKENNVEKVSQRDAYNTLSDSKTEKLFRELVQRSSADYLKYGGNREYNAVLQNVKKYVTASHRATQQEALVALNKSIASMKAKWTKNPPREGSPEQEMLKSLDFYSGRLMEFTNGSLELPENEKPKPGDPKPDEPADAGLGYLGRWTRFEGPVFPHEPSPNDIKQGRVNDCFMMASLIKIANDHPEKIREAIRDNGDGTVSVRFFKRKYVDGQPVKDPVYIRVNKTVKKTLTGQHIYSSSSPWVQMVEKAYALYVTDRQPERQGEGFQLLDRGNPNDFLDAFDKDSFYAASNNSIGYHGDAESKKRYALNAPKPEGYTEYEKELFKLLSRTNDGEAMTVGTDPTAEPSDPARDKYISSVGIHKKHAYALLGTFEKDGKKYVQLQDPFASFRAGYDKNGNLVSNSNAVFATLNAGGTNMGKFNLELGDFLRTFDSINSMTKAAKLEMDKLPKNTLEADISREKKEKPVENTENRPDEGTKNNEGEVKTDIKDPVEEEPAVNRQEQPVEKENYAVINNARSSIKRTMQAFKNGEIDSQTQASQVKDCLAEVLASFANMDVKKRLSGKIPKEELDELTGKENYERLLQSTKESKEFGDTFDYLTRSPELLSNFLKDENPHAVKALFDSYVDANKRKDPPVKHRVDTSKQESRSNSLGKV